MDTEKVRLAETIDTWVQDIVRQSSSDEQADEQILTNMIALVSAKSGLTKGFEQ